MDPTTGTAPYALRPSRELGALSDFAVEQLGDANERVRVGQMSADELLWQAERFSRSVPDAMFRDVLRDERRRRGASLDLAFVERSLAIGHESSPDYREKRRNLDLFRKA